MNAAPTKLAVLGQGYVGLPLAMRAVEVGHDVVGYDVEPARIKRLAAESSRWDEMVAAISRVMKEA